jgi:hypothetical protein
MKPIVQLERSGCGIAIMAARAGVTYAQTKRDVNRLGLFADDPRLWSETDYVRKLLKEYGFRWARTEAPFISERPCLILRCSTSHGTGFGVARSGIGWCFGEGLVGLSCSTRSAHSVAMCAPTSVA